MPFHPCSSCFAALFLVLLHISSAVHLRFFSHVFPSAYALLLLLLLLLSVLNILGEERTHHTSRLLIEDIKCRHRIDLHLAVPCILRPCQTAMPLYYCYVNSPVAVCWLFEFGMQKTQAPSRDPTHTNAVSANRHASDQLTVSMASTRTPISCSCRASSGASCFARLPVPSTNKSVARAQEAWSRHRAGLMCLLPVHGLAGVRPPGTGRSRRNSARLSSVTSDHRFARQSVNTSPGRR